MSATTTSAPKAIIHPVVDALAIGGLSIAFILYLMIFEPAWATGSDKLIAERYVYLTALLNWPHFMATYALMYRSKETVQRYPMASKWMPLALGITCMGAVASAHLTGNDYALKLLTWMAGGYLAWHYTGQTWGMMASFSFLTGAGIKDGERTLIRTGLRVLLAWHLVWFFHTVEVGGSALKESATYLTIYTYFTYVAIPVGTTLGLIGLWRYRKRIERTPAPRVLIPFVAIVLWYVAMAIDPIAIFWVQLGHSLQYLLFPMRVEINRGAKVERSPLASAGIFVFFAFGLGLLTWELIPWTVGLAVPAASIAYVKAGIGAFVNIHHYFADGVIWKISNPAVRKELFAHIRGPS